MAYTSAQLQSKAQRDKVNESMRASPQWRDAIKGMGLNPDGPLKLNGDQQKRLAATLGLPTSDFHIDGAGNINDYHGWKGLPVAAKVAIIAGAAVVTAGAAGAFSAPAAEMAVTTTAGGGIPAATGGALTATGAVAGTGATAAGTTAAVTGGGAAAKTGFAALAKKYAPEALSIGSSVAKGAAADMANNRGNQLEASILQEKMRQDQMKIWEDQLLARQKEGRANSNDAWNKLMTGSYTASYKGAGPDANNPYVLPMAGATDAQVEAGNALATASRPKVTDGNIGLPALDKPVPYQVDPSLLSSGGWEKLLGYGGAAGDAIDAWRKLQQFKKAA